MKRPIIGLSIAFAAFLTRHAPAQELFTPTDLKHLVHLSEPQLSPDGKSGIFIVSFRDHENNTFKRELVLTDLKGNQRTLVRDRANISQPLWSPDGMTISFLANGTKGTQIFLLPMEGGDSRQLTTHGTSIKKYSWHPAGRHLCYIAEEETEKKTGPDRFNDAFEVGSNSYLTRGPSARNSIWLIDITGTVTERLTFEDKTVATDLTVSPLSWSQDGTRLAFVSYPTSNPGDSDRGKIFWLNLNGRIINAGPDRELEAGVISFSPTGEQIAYTCPVDGVPANQNSIYVYDIKGKSITNVTRNLDHEIGDFTWLGDGRMFMTGNNQLSTALWLRADPGKFTAINLGKVEEVSAWSICQNGSTLYIGEEKYRPSELYYKSDPEAEPERLTNYNSELASRKSGKREGFEWKSTKDLTANGVITYPPKFSESNKYPLVVLIHGGPTSTSSLAFTFMAQLMAARGWLVFEPNYRGSNNLGNAFQSAIANDPSQGPGEDIMTGVTELKKLPYVDAKRIAVSGWSYGGWMTAWLIGRYPLEWVAAVAGAAPVDLTDMYSLSDLNRMRRHAMTDSPFRGDQLLWAQEQSPLKYLSRIVTPTLILSKTEDARVSITGSYKLYSALRDNGIPVQFIAYPGPGHVVTDPVRSLDLHERWLNWLEKYLGAPRPLSQN